jgi:hypothetical protein
MDRILPMRMDWIPFPSENGPYPAYENGMNPVSAMPLKWTGILSVWEWIGFGLVLDKFTMIQILPLRMGRILPMRMDRIPFLLWKMDRDPVCMIMN